MCRYNIYYRNGKQQHRKLSTTNATYFCLARVSKKETSKKVRVLAMSVVVMVDDICRKGIYIDGLMVVITLHKKTETHQWHNSSSRIFRIKKDCVCVSHSTQSTQLLQLLGEKKVGVVSLRCRQSCSFLVDYFIKFCSSNACTYVAPSIHTILCRTTTKPSVEKKYGFGGDDDVDDRDAMHSVGAAAA